MNKLLLPVISALLGVFVALTVIMGCLAVDQEMTQIREKLFKAKTYITKLEAQNERLQRGYGIEAPKVTENDIVSYIQHCNYRVPAAEARVIARAIMEAARVYELPVKVLLALVEIESTFKTEVVSEAEAIGLMQVHTHTWFNADRPVENLVDLGLVQGVKDLYDPAKNIMAGGYILNHYYRSAIQNGYDKPMQRALTRYYGGNINGHYARICRAMGKFQIFSLTN